MKIEKRISYIIIILLLVNIIYYKLAKNIQKETLKIIENGNSLNTEISSNQVNLIESNEDNYQSEKDKIANNKLSTDVINTNTISNNTMNNYPTNNTKNDFTNDNSDDLVPEIGNNIKDGLTPDPFLNHNINLIRKTDDEVDNKIKSFSTHLKSFLIILSVISTISLLIFAVGENNRQKRLNSFDVYIRSNDSYHLLRD